MQAQIELSGLSKVESVREAAQPVEMYVKIPIKMSLTGTYHQINRFFKQVGELKRIVNIEDLSLDPLALGVGAARRPNPLKANFMATTFMFTDKGAGAKKVGHVNQLGRWQVKRAADGGAACRRGRLRRRRQGSRGSAAARRRRRRRRRRRDRRWRRCSRASSSPRRRCCKRCASGS